MNQLGYALCLRFTLNEVLSTLHLLNSTKHGSMLLMSAQVVERLQLKLVIGVITDHIILTMNVNLPWAVKKIVTSFQCCVLLTMWNNYLQSGAKMSLTVLHIHYLKKCIKVALILKGHLEGPKWLLLWLKILLHLDRLHKHFYREVIVIL